MLLALTFLTTTAFGCGFFFSTRTDVVTDLVADPGWLLLGHPAEFFSALISIPWAVWTTPQLLKVGLSFSLPLLTILLSHELGHFFACRRHRVLSTLPYLLPAPLLIGTFGAFIRIQSRIRSRRELFDIGAAGPIAGFVALLPFLLYGLASSNYSPIVEIDPELGGNLLLVPGRSAISRSLLLLMHGPLEPGMAVDYHPVALAAWVGLFVTALNLIPVGQLDGGHILFAVSSVWHRRLRPLLIGALAVMGFWWPGWWLWFGILLLIARRHPPVLRPGEPLDSPRWFVAWITLTIFILVFVPVPLSVVAVLS